MRVFLPVLFAICIYIFLSLTLPIEIALWLLLTPAGLLCLYAVITAYTAWAEKPRESNDSF